MRKFRINNDIPVIWRIVDKQTLLPFDLKGKTVQVVLQNRFSVIPIRDFRIDGNIIAFVFRASQQANLGVYTITATITDEADQTWTADGCEIFELVPRSCCADVCESHSVDATSCVEFAQFIVVDQEVNPESANPVSGAAVAKALESINPENLIRTTYEELVALRDNSLLVPGKWYRITDYVATVNSDMKIGGREVFVPASHDCRIDILVLATSTNVLSEEARAMQNDSNDYFDDQYVESWKVWYSLDNNKERFNWALPQGGKGVIYRLIDQNNNDLPFDFKGIMILAPIANGYILTTLDIDEWKYAFAFNYDNWDGTEIDISLHGMVKDCRFAPMYSDYAQAIPQIVFTDGEATGSFPAIKSVSIGPDCTAIYGWGDTMSVEIGSLSSDIWMEKCENVTIGSSCNEIMLGANGGEYVHNNIVIGNGCDAISMLNECREVSIGEGCSGIAFNRLIASNVEIGNGCINLVFNNAASDISSLVVDPVVTNFEMGVFEPNLRILKGASGLNIIGPTNNVNTGRALYVTSDYKGNVSSWYEGDNPKFIEATHSELASMAAGKLIPGSVYRLTDYSAVFSASYLSASENWEFDIFLTAISIELFDENAFAIATHKTSGKTKYLRVKYAFNNTVNRFPWASSSDKGVIYYMEDEQGNYAPFDFLSYVAIAQPCFLTDKGPIIRNPSLDEPTSPYKYAYSRILYDGYPSHVYFTNKADPMDIIIGDMFWPTSLGSGNHVAVREYINVVTGNIGFRLYEDGDVLKIQPNEQYYLLPFIKSGKNFIVNGAVGYADVVDTDMNPNVRIDGTVDFAIFNSDNYLFTGALPKGQFSMGSAVVRDCPHVTLALLHMYPIEVIGLAIAQIEYNTLEYCGAYRFLQTVDMDAPIVQNMETFENEGMLEEV